ncbi:MAG: hypothetical protein RBU37_23500 [Myxococcota bacterium]|jgi:hypothetical protein|nr:hypothetical protein [Myxococcota bacterium]
MSKKSTPMEDGLGALLKPDRDRIDAAIRDDFADSLDLDAGLREGREGEHRWDYLVGHVPSAALIGIEPHSATTGEVRTVIEKRRQALVQLREHLVDGASIARWLWVASGDVDFVPLEKAVLRLNQNGITFVGRKLLAKDLPAPQKRSASKKGQAK